MSDHKRELLRRFNPRMYEEIYGRKDRKFSHGRTHKYGATRVWLCWNCELIWQHHEPRAPETCPVCKHPIKKGLSFPSKLEAAVYMMCLQEERLGVIMELQRQASVELPGGVRWKIDFGYRKPMDPRPWYREAKGVKDPVFKLKLELFRSAPPGCLEIWEGSPRNLRLTELIEPAA